MRRIQFVTLIVILTLGLLLSGCGLLNSGAAPTPDPLVQQATIDAAVTQAVLTMAANLTSTAAAIPTSTFTFTPTVEPPTATATATVVIPTATKTLVPYTPKPTNTATTAAFSCELLSTAPAGATKININTDFDAIWVVKNTGAKDWEIGYLDLKYISGTKMQTVADIFDISTAVEAGDELTLIVDMKTPSTAAKYTAAWALAIDGKTLCSLPVNIEAVKP